MSRPKEAHANQAKKSALSNKGSLLPGYRDAPLGRSTPLYVEIIFSPEG